MPTYRYRCGSCGNDLEIWQSITDDSLTEHDSCGGPLVKVLSPAGIVLKGSGFYKTDARSGSSGNGSRTPKESSTDAGSNESGSKESGAKDGASKDGGAKDGGAKSDSAGSSTTKSDSGTKSSSPSKESGST